MVEGILDPRISSHAIRKYLRIDHVRLASGDKARGYAVYVKIER